ncbi:hypothetical protein PIB30_071125 [Stylosanthes scabra]|uniref:Putative plant transposon protein domain-containing protein n=1 Tax=Stylosanthes scabra TaxID=79078 RepID=A0ABU6VNP5_9FABA|nr:hypothetical protein [Stylosanthes scabra]
MASTSSVSVFDNHGFKSAFYEELYNTIVKNKKVIAEVCFDLMDDEYPEIQEEMEEHGGHSYKSFVRGVLINFSPENIQRVMRFKAQLRREELNPIARGWHELSIHSLIPSSNRSEIPVIRAILIHCIMNGEDVRVEEIIADKMVRMAQGIKEMGKLGFPSTIYKLCKEAGVPLREFRQTKKIPAKKPITARRVESTRLPRNLQHQPQDNKDEDQSMPQAEEGHGEKQGEEHDYQHH